MGDTLGSPTISMKLQSIAAQARRYPEMVFNNVFHLIDDDFLREAYRRTRKDSAPGVDKVTAKQYAENLDEHLRDLHERRRANRYVAPPVERVWIAKEGGKKRPRSKPCFEDKIVQRAVVMILEAIFEPAFQAFSDPLHERPKVVDSLPGYTSGMAGCGPNLASQVKLSRRLSGSTDGTIRPL